MWRVKLEEAPFTIPSRGLMTTNPTGNAAASSVRGRMKGCVAPEFPKRKKAIKQKQVGAIKYT